MVMSIFICNAISSSVVLRLGIKLSDYSTRKAHGCSTDECCRISCLDQFIQTVGTVHVTKWPVFVRIRDRKKRWDVLISLSSIVSDMQCFPNLSVYIDYYYSSSNSFFFNSSFQGMAYKLLLMELSSSCIFTISKT